MDGPFYCNGYMLKKTNQVTAVRESTQDDCSNGWEAVAKEFIEVRAQSTVGAEMVRHWASKLPAAASVLDLGCGSGVPISQSLIERGCMVSGLDASPTLIAEFNKRFKNMRSVCESVESSNFFGESFDGVVAIGLVFLLPVNVQRSLIHRVGSVLNHGGHFLFTSPRQQCSWSDMTTGLESRSLGHADYVSIFSETDLILVGNYTDEGDNYYYDLRKGT